MVNKITLYVDADACPVKKEIVDCAGLYDIQAVFVASYAGFSPDRQSAWIFVDQEKEAADLYILNHARPGDAVVTQDMGLAGLLAGRGVSVLSDRGREIMERDVPEILNRRYISRKSRAAGRRIRGPKPFAAEDRKKFSAALTNLLCRLGH
ncbi:DUF188 domain-containing protein [Sporolactobacillus sp. CQH2019]|uniref:YaiI/YqxD family protein n=1 Tax=Sporolactobacillus sp. CQH2019 TaxID=3023512 RepID=UPI002367DD20|nr:DUF188 domain-containing protein [Sporolactobacillus sp. CQH2019]MDD9147578.1 DUF188 domain-containing protein [Sporolactobacillus sp. CQH2019]